MKTAKMTVVITHRYGEFAAVPIIKTFEMSDDLPAEDIGIGLAQAINDAWKSGLDPVTEMSISIHFS